LNCRNQAHQQQQLEAGQTAQTQQERAVQRLRPGAMQLLLSWWRCWAASSSSSCRSLAASR
jgi:hypothetical protein